MLGKRGEIARVGDEIGIGQVPGAGTGRDQFLITGKEGTVLIGARDRWSTSSNPDFDEDLWGIVEFHDEVYVAGYGGLGRLRGERVEPLDLGLGRTVLGYRLRACDGLLWSIGNDDLLMFDGKAWTEVICPDNVP